MYLHIIMIEEFLILMRAVIAVIYGPPRRYSNISKTFKKIEKKLKYIYMTILGLAEKFKR